MKLRADIPEETRRRAFRARAVAIALGLAAFTLYLHLGGELARTAAFDHDDLLFEIDVERAIGDMTVHVGGHYRTSVHPVYVLLVNPVGTALADRVGSRVAAAVVLNAALAALAVALAVGLFRRLLDDLLAAGLLGAVFALTSSQLVLGAVPDTASAAVVTLVATWSLFLAEQRHGRARLAVWIPMAVVAFGVTTTNLVQPAIAFGLLSWERWRRGEPGAGELVRVVRFAAGVLGTTVALALVQKWIYPSSDLFFLPSALAEELDYSSTLILSDPGRVLGELLRHVFVVNFVAPEPRLLELAGRTYVTFVGAHAHGAVTLTATAAWLSMLAVAAVALVRRAPFERLLALGLTGAVAANLGLHSIYGIGEKGRIEYFLYSGNFTFAVLALVVCLAAPSVGRRWRALATALVVASLAVANLPVMAAITAAYR